MENSYSYTVKNFESAEITSEKRIDVDQCNKSYTDLLPEIEKPKNNKHNDIFDEIGCELGEVVLNMTEYWNNDKFLDMKSISVISSEIIRKTLKNVKIIETPIEIDDVDKEIEIEEDF